MTWKVERHFVQRGLVQRPKITTTLNVLRNHKIKSNRDDNNKELIHLITLNVSRNVSGNYSNRNYRNKDFNNKELILELLQKENRSKESQQILWNNNRWVERERAKWENEAISMLNKARLTGCCSVIKDHNRIYFKCLLLISCNTSVVNCFGMKANYYKYHFWAKEHNSLQLKENNFNYVKKWLLFL